MNWSYALGVSIRSAWVLQRPTNPTNIAQTMRSTRNRPLCEMRGTGPCSMSSESVAHYIMLMRLTPLTILPCSVTSSAHRVPIYSVNRSKPETAARLRLLESHGQSIKPITFPTDVPIQSNEEYLAAMAKRGPREPTG